MKTIAFNPNSRSVGGYKKPLGLFTRRDGHTRPVMIQVKESTPQPKGMLYNSSAQYTRRDGYHSPVVLASEPANRPTPSHNNIWY